MQSESKSKVRNRNFFDRVRTAQSNIRRLHNASDPGSIPVTGNVFFFLFRRKLRVLSLRALCGNPVCTVSFSAVRLCLRSPSVRQTKLRFKIDYCFYRESPVRKVTYVVCENKRVGWGHRAKVCFAPKKDHR